MLIPSLSSYQMPNSSLIMKDRVRIVGNSKNCSLFFLHNKIKNNYAINSNNNIVLWY